MTKREQKEINAFMLRLCKSKRRRLVPAKVFDKRSRPGKQLVVVPVGTIISEWNKLKKMLES